MNKCQNPECEKRIKILEEEVLELREKLNRLIKPPKNSGNSGIASSKDENKKYYPPREKSGKEIGGQLGHKGITKTLSENPDEIVEFKEKICPNCGSEQIKEIKTLSKRQLIELPEVKVLIKEYQTKLCECENCKELIESKFPENIKAPIQYGDRVKAVSGYLKTQHNLSHNKISQLMSDVLGLEISEGTIDEQLTELAEDFREDYGKILEGLKESEVVGSDETTNRVNGKSLKSWIFENKELAFFKSACSRAYSVIEDLFEKNYPKVWVSDRYGSQLKVPVQHQVCLAHVIRDLKYVNQCDNSEWARSLEKLLKECIHSRNEGKITIELIEEKRKELDKLFEREPPRGKEEKIKLNSLKKEKLSLLYFLENPLVPPTNNGSERGLRRLVIHRKINGGFRSDKGAERYHILASIIETAIRQGKNIFDVLVKKVSLSFQPFGFAT